MDAALALEWVVVAGAVGLSGYLLWRWIAGTLRGGEGCAGCPLAAACGSRRQTETAAGDDDRGAGTGRRA